jgi:hypothetical protein
VGVALGHGESGLGLPLPQPHARNIHVNIRKYFNSSTTVEDYLKPFFVKAYALEDSSLDASIAAARKPKSE